MKKVELFVRLSANPFVENMTDEELIQKIYKGEECAFTEIYYRFQSPIFRFAFHMTGSMSAAEDVTQEVFLTLLQFQKYNPSKGPIVAYLFGIARHHVLRWMKKNQNYVPYSLLNEEAASQAGDLTHDRKMEIEDVRKAILTLPLKYREAIILCDLQEKSYEETSQILGCAIGTIRSRLHRARSLLLKKLTGSHAAEKTKGATYGLPAL
jgi:RNA polymerase sigma-70 factor, ECF subfamily